MFLKNILDNWLNVSNHNVILFPFGGDVAFKYAQNDFEIIDRLVKKLDEVEVGNYFIHAWYGTLDDYFKMINKSSLSIFKSDFLPYEERVSKLHPLTEQGDKLDYWVGYYS